ncbi:MAG: PilW family protein [Culicoidibacterales bacterium]
MQLKTEKGITLVELLAILALTGLLLSVIMQFFMVNLNGMNHQNVRAQLQREVTMIVEKLNQETYGATKVAIGENQQSLQVCQLDGQQTIFVQVDDKLMQDSHQLARYLQNVQFTFDSTEANMIVVELNLAMPNGRHTVEYSETTTVRMRNYQEDVICEISN